MGENDMKVLQARTIFTLLASLILITITASPVLSERTQPPIEWTNTYGSVKIDYGYCVQQTTDHGYIITGAYGRNLWDPWAGYLYLLKVDQQGNEQWHQTHGIANNENVGKAVRQTTDGGYIVAGYTGSTYHLDGLVEKTDDTGTITWFHTYGASSPIDRCNDVRQTSDGGYIICGFTQTYGAGGGDAWLIKLQADGTETWNHTFGGTGLDQANSLLQTTDGYIIVGSTFSYGHGGDLWIIKTDAQGNELWNNTIGGSDYDEALGICPARDGGYALTGSTQNYGTGGGDVWLVKIDANGNQQWNTTFGGIYLDAGNSIQQTSDNGYFITGQYSNQTTNTPDFYIIKTDPVGGLDWQQIIDNNGADDYANYGIPTADGGYIVTGDSGPSMTESVDVWLIKYQSNNQPPTMPSNPIPPDNATGQDFLALNLSWTGGDPDSNLVYYTVSLGSTSPPPIVARNLTHTYYTTGLLKPNTTYYWQIRAVDGNGATTIGLIWSFMTKPAPILEITSITGLVGIHATIKNNGSSEATNVVWRVNVTGGIRDHVKVNISDYLKQMPAGLEVPIMTGPFFGIGKITVTVTATCTENPTPVQQTVTGRIRLFFLVKLDS
jgi:hypothetical protein